MEYKDKSCEEFMELLASKAAVPGGGGAAALVGSIGAALGNMVGNLTIGKPKYAEVQAAIEQLNAQAEQLRERLLDLIDEDAKAFEPLSKAYGLPKNTPEEQIIKKQVMEKALKEACAVPLKIMCSACKAIELHREMAAIGTTIAISDVGVGVICCRTALAGAALNVFINTKSMADREYAARINMEANRMLDEYIPLSDQIYVTVRQRLK